MHSLAKNPFWIDLKVRSIRFPTLVQCGYSKPMNRFLRLVAVLVLSLCVSEYATGSPAPVAAPSQTNVNNAIIRRLSVLANRDKIEVTIYASRQVTAQTQTLRAPDRVVIDFPGTLPGSELRGVTVSRGQLKAVRVGLLQAGRPGTRVVLDLTAPQQYQL